MLIETCRSPGDEPPRVTIHPLTCGKLAQVFAVSASLFGQIWLDTARGDRADGSPSYAPSSLQALDRPPRRAGPALRRRKGAHGGKRKAEGRSGRFTASTGGGKFTQEICRCIRRGRSVSTTVHMAAQIVPLTCTFANVSRRPRLWRVPIVAAPCGRGHADLGIVVWSERN